jgi:hypothetical protein
MASYKKDSPMVKKAEEKAGKDMDGDSEKGESPAHRAKVLGAGKGKGKGKGQGMPMKTKGKKGMCAACMKAGASSCSH